MSLPIPDLKKSILISKINFIKSNNAKSKILGNKTRKLSKKEIEKLQEQGNYSKDWNKILVAENFKTEFIHQSNFSGSCFLGIFDGTEIQVDSSSSLPSGIYRSNIINSKIGNNCLISDTGVISNYIIMNNSVIFYTGALIASDECTYGNGISIPIGIEIGGRDILSYAEMTIPVAESIVLNKNNPSLLKKYNQFINDYTASCIMDCGIVESNTVIRYTNKIEDSYISEGTIIDGANLIKNTLLLGSCDEKINISHNAYISNSCIQWGCTVTSMAIVEKSILTEYSLVERHGKIKNSIIGPNSEVGEGEITSSLVGPFVGFHHQALLIAAIWPQGKGNIGYGANVGSNHTSKAPDQEIICGEGMFFGLGSSIKFPSDFSEAPYSIIATAVNTLPQKVVFPFSLINKPSIYVENISPSYNEIIPAWVLSNNIYSIRRNEKKYRIRDKAKRTSFIYNIFRPEIIDKIITARNSLQNIDSIKNIYTDNDIPGLGKNFLNEKNRNTGIETYNFYIKFYSLQTLKEKITQILKNNSLNEINNLYSAETTDPIWEHSKQIIISESFNKKSLKENLNQLKNILNIIAKNTEQSKQRDDVRGEKIIKDYMHTHVKASDDPFIIETWEETKKAIEEIDSIISKLN